MIFRNLKVLVVLVSLVFTACGDPQKKAFSNTELTKEELNAAKSAGSSSDTLYYSQKVIQTMRLTQLILAPFIFGDRFTLPLPSCIETVQPNLMWKWNSCPVGATHTIKGDTVFTYSAEPSARDLPPAKTFLSPDQRIPSKISSRLYFVPNAAELNSSKRPQKNYIWTIEVSNIAIVGNLVRGDIELIQYVDQISESKKLQEIKIESFESTFSKHAYDTVAFGGVLVQETYMEPKELPAGFIPSITQPEMDKATLDLRFLPSSRMRQSAEDAIPQGSWDFLYNGRKKILDGEIVVNGSRIQMSKTSDSLPVTCQNFCFSL